MLRMRGAYLSRRQTTGVELGRLRQLDSLFYREQLAEIDLTAFQRFAAIPWEVQNGRYSPSRLLTESCVSRDSRVPKLRPIFKSS